MLLEKRKTPGGEPEAFPNTFATTLDDTDRAVLVASVSAAVVGGLLHLDRFVAREYLAKIPPAAIGDLCHRYVLEAAGAAVGYGTAPTPLACLEAARRAGLTAPPGWRGLVLSELVQLASDAPPVAMLEWHIGRLLAYHAFSVVEQAGHRIADGAWRSDPQGLAVLVQREAAHALAALAVDDAAAGAA